MLWLHYCESTRAGAEVAVLRLVLGDYLPFTRGYTLALAAGHAALGGALGFALAWRFDWHFAKVGAAALAVAMLPVLRAAAIQPAVFEPHFQLLGQPGESLLEFLAETAGPRPIEALLVVVSIALLGRVALAAAALALAASLWPARTPPAPARPHVILMIADSLRPDYLGFGGHRKPVSPHLDALAASGFVFTEAHTVLPRTAGSWASLQTGRYPAETGITTTFSRQLVPKPPSRTLASAFARAGYHTAALGSAIERHLAGEGWGFEHVDLPAADFKSYIAHGVLLKAPLLLPLALAHGARGWFPESRGALWLASDPAYDARLLVDCLRRHGDRPVFATLFFSHCHVPYSTPQPDGLRFCDPAYEGPARYGALPDQIGPTRPGEPIRDRVIQLYEGAIAATDRAAGAVLSYLRDAGLERDTIVVFMSDHGESLFEDGVFGHGEDLRPVNTHVPLVVRAPGLQGRSGAIVRTIDVAPTLCDLAGLPPLEGASGVSLRGAMQGRDPGLIGYSETDLWLRAAETDQERRERIDYPSFWRTTVVDGDNGHLLLLRRDVEFVVEVAKRRRVWNRDGALEYWPTSEGPRWHKQGRWEPLQAELDRLMLERFGWSRAPNGGYVFRR